MPRRPRNPQVEYAEATDLPPPQRTPESDREIVANFWRERMEQIESEHAQRVELLRTAGEHPSPVFARQVKSAGALGLGKSVTAKLLGLSVRTLETHYAEEYELGAAETVSLVAANAIRIGTSLTDPNNAKMALAILDRRGGDEWKPPTHKIETTHVKPEQKNVIDTSGWSSEDRQQLREMLSRNVAGAPPESDSPDAEVIEGGGDPPDGEDECPVTGGLVPT